MRILDRWRRKRQEREDEEQALDQMRRADERDEQVPSATYTSQTRD